MLHVEHAGKKYQLHVKYFTKKTTTRIAGKTVDNKDFELVSTKPMDYYIEEYKNENS